MVLTTTYFGSVGWYRQLACAKGVVAIEACEHFVKQTERSRCRIMTANGVQTLTVPVSIPKEKGGSNIGNVLISDHANWRKVHWQALVSAYGNSPFFEFYADDIKPFFERRWERLFDYNMDITRKMCELLDIHPQLEVTREYVPDRQAAVDMEWQERPYYQVFRSRYGFVGGMSILDLLFNMGPEAILYLQR